MPTFNNQSVFDSGPSRLTPGPVTLRSTEQDAPLGHGASLLNQGTHTRPITQRGQLLADDPASLYELMDAIEDMIDGQAYPLADGAGRQWPGCVMTRFEPGTVVRRGTRVGVDYTIHYTQVQP